MSSYYTPQSKTLALLPKFTGFLSLMGSTFIFQDIVKRPVKNVYHRLMLGLCISDMVASIVNVLSTWPIPAGTPGVFLASGTTQTCTAQGFFNELGNVGMPLYNASLCVYYVLVIRNNWTEDSIRSRAETILHMIPTIVASTIAILGIPLKLYNNSGWLCWIAPYPSNCTKSGDCTRGELAHVFRWVHYAIIWSAILFVTLGMYSIYRSVKAKDQVSPQDNVSRREMKSRKVAVQAALFVGALYITWVFTTITRIYQITTGHNSFPLLVLMAIFFPLQGFFNALIYIRPRYLGFKAHYPMKSAFKLFLMALSRETSTISPSQPPPNVMAPKKPLSSAEDSGDKTGSSNSVELPVV